MSDLFGLVVLHLWRHPKIVKGCEVCRLISPPKRKPERTPQP